MDKEKTGNVPQSGPESLDDELPQAARLLLLAKRLGLKAETLSELQASLMPQELQGKNALKIKDEFSFRQGARRETSAPPQLVGELGELVEELDRISIPVTELALGEPGSGRDARDLAAKKGPGPEDLSARSGPEPNKPVQIDLALEAERNLRKKIEAEQSWANFRVEAWNLYENFPRPDMAARLVELAFLYGSAAELEDVLASLVRHAITFYTQIASEIRIHLVLKLWQARRRAVLDGLLFRKDLTLRLLPIERLYCCWSYIEANQSDAAYKFFRRHDQEIWSAHKLYGPQVKLSESAFALLLGEIALRERDEALATRLLESIPQHAPEFQKALDILLDIRVERDNNGLCAYGQKMKRELDWRGRVGLLDSFLLRVQRFEAGAPKDRAALNEMLKNPLQWFPESVEAWQALAEVLLQYQQLEYLLPNILNFFQVQATQFNKPAFDHAVWAAVRQHDFASPERNWFWQSIALMHEFTWHLGEKESPLWEARRLYHEAKDHSDKALALSWNQLHRALLQWISKTERLDEAQRQRLLLIARLLGETSDITEADINNYLGQVAHPSQKVIAALENLTRDRQQAGLETYILDRKAKILHYTNADFSRLWQLAFQLKRYDQCWRVASLLRSRRVMNEALERHWSICGEKKREFNIIDLQDLHVKKIIHSFDGDERRLAEALVTIGPLIPELLAGLNQHLVAVKKGRGLSEIESEIHNAMEKTTWMPQPKRMFSTNPSGLWQSKPPFFASLLDTKWSLVFMALAQRLGLTAWDWQLSLLHHQIEALVPRMARGAELPAPGKVGRWLRNLTPLQRKAWYELAQLSRRFEDEQAQLLFAQFLAKLTTTMLQDHPLALSSLEKMRAPLRLRWDLEHWIASDVYGEIRRSIGSSSIGQYADEVFSSPVLAQNDALTMGPANSVSKA